MKENKNTFNLFKYIGNIIRSKKSKGEVKPVKKYQPSWMYRNE
ncbi:MAG: hypothetical protein ACI9P5_003477 [Saprospiraceae bacterium]|jgi:hypothetical protein